MEMYYGKMIKVIEPQKDKLQAFKLIYKYGILEYPSVVIFKQLKETLAKMMQVFPNNEISQKLATKQYDLNYLRE
jgi:hypothetical protein